MLVSRAQEHATAEKLPRQFGAYQLLASLGRGGMGEVLLARHSALEGVDRLCIVKTLRADLTADDEYARRFLDEARVVVQLQHAHVCSVFDVGRIDGELFLAMEYVQGTNLRTLQQRLAELGREIPPSVGLLIAEGILAGLEYAHNARHPLTDQPLGIVHRDVSPQNTMVSYSGDVKVIDFGLAVSELKEEQTEDDQVLGKVAYMSPEQARGESLDARSDQYAVGITLYELFTSKRFYDDTPRLEIWTRAGRGGYRPEHWDALPDGVGPILERSLRALPESRWPSCQQMRAQLEALRRRRWPEADPADTRALMLELFEDRLQQTRAYLRDVHTSQPNPEVSPPTPGSSSWQRDDPRLVGPTDAQAGAQDRSRPGSVSEREASFHGRADREVPEGNTGRSVSTSTSWDTHRTLTLPLALGGGVGALLLAAILLWPGGGGRRSTGPDPGVQVTAPTQPADAPAEVPAPAQQPDPDPVVVDDPPAPDAGPSAGGTEEPDLVGDDVTKPSTRSARRRARGRRAMDQPAVAAPDTPEPAAEEPVPTPATTKPEPTPTTPKPAAAKKRTLAEDLSILRACDRPEARDVYRRVQEQGGAAQINSKARVLVAFWAKNCASK